MYGLANKAFVAVAGFKPTFLISACVVVLVPGYVRVTGDGVGEARGDLFTSSTAFLRLRAKELACPVNHLLSPRPLLCERPLGTDYYMNLVYTHSVILIIQAI